MGGDCFVSCLSKQDWYIYDSPIGIMKNRSASGTLALQEKSYN